MEILFSGKYDRQDLLEILKLHHVKTRLEYWMRVALAASAFLVYLAKLAFTTAGSLVDELGFALPMLIIILVAGMPLLRPYLILPRLMKDRDVQETISGAAIDDCLVWNTAQSKGEMKWDVFKKAIVRQNLVLLYQENNWFTPVPRSFFQDDADWKAFLDLIGRKISGEGPAKK